MTQVINLKDHLPQDLRNGANQGSMQYQRLYLAQQKLAKQLKVNTGNDSYVRYGTKSGYGNQGNVTTTAGSSKSKGPSLFNFTQSPQNGYSGAPSMQIGTASG